MIVRPLGLPLQYVGCVSAYPAGSLVEHGGRLLAWRINVSRYIGMNVINIYLDTMDLGFTESIISKVDTLLLKLVVWYADRSNISSSSALAIPHASREAASFSGEELPSSAAS